MTNEFGGAFSTFDLRDLTQRPSGTSREVSVLLGHESRWETEDFLSAHDAWPGLTAEEAAEDSRTLSSSSVESTSDTLLKSTHVHRRHRYHKRPPKRPFHATA